MAAALAGLALFAAAPAAQAATTAANPLSCVPQASLSQTFLPWGDRGLYTPSPRGNFEAGLTGWVLTGGAGLASRNEPFKVGSAADKTSLALPAGSSAVSAPICIDDTYPWFRLFARNTGTKTAGLKIEVLYLDSTGNIKVRAAGTHKAAPMVWAPTGTLQIALTFDPTTAGGAAPVSFRFTAKDSSWQIDDVYVDPMARR